jgi:tRNA modification GTPase
MKDTITALATPPGESGIAVIRISGDEAIKIVADLFQGKANIIDVASNTIHYGSIVYQNTAIDTVTIAVFRHPHSYTGENVVEISCHGSMIVVDAIIDILIKSGARLAEQGEFTKRAFLNGKLNLTQVEAVADIIKSRSLPSALTSVRQLHGEFNKRLKEFNRKLLNIVSLLELELDFSEEDIAFTDRCQVIALIEEIVTFCKELINSYQQAKIYRSGYFIGIAGYPNSGKSTLFNTLLKKQRAIVSHIPGTTRDYIEETLYIGNIPVKIIDTAGIRESDDIIEVKGIRLAQSVLEEVNMILVINDAFKDMHDSDHLVHHLRKIYPEKSILLLQNKIDKLDTKLESKATIFNISAKYSEGISELRTYIENEIKLNTDRISDVLINQRHQLLFTQILECLERALKATQENLENEIITIDLRQASNLFSEITGEKWNDDVLKNIFSNFCIGK